MTDLLQNLLSPSWWVGVVLVSFAVNLASAYFKPSLDSFLYRTFSWWRARSAERRSRRDEAVELLRKDKHRQLVLLAEEARCRSRELQFFFMGCVLLVLIATEQNVGRPMLQWALSALFFIVLVIAFQQRLAATKIQWLVTEASPQPGER